MSPLALTLSILAATFTLVGAILAIVFRSLRRRRARQLHELQSEGIVLDSGSRPAVYRFRNFRSRRFSASYSAQATRCQLVLTKTNFVILGGNLLRIPFAEMGRYTIRAENGHLLVTTDQPLGATGHMELSVKLDDAEAWSVALEKVKG